MNIDYNYCKEPVKAYKALLYSDCERWQRLPVTSAKHKKVAKMPKIVKMWCTSTLPGLKKASAASQVRGQPASSVTS